MCSQAHLRSGHWPIDRRAACKGGTMRRFFLHRCPFSYSLPNARFPRNALSPTATVRTFFAKERCSHLHILVPRRSNHLLLACCPGRGCATTSSNLHGLLVCAWTSTACPRQHQPVLPTELMCPGRAQHLRVIRSWRTCQRPAPRRLPWP